MIHQMPSVLLKSKITILHKDLVQTQAFAKMCMFKGKQAHTLELTHNIQISL